MFDQTSDDQDMIDAYFNIIEQRILEPIRRTDVRLYCTATLLLLFAAIDGLGKLLHPEDKARSNERIRGFLDYMGGDYEVRKGELLKLRHSLVHNAINVESFLSQTELGRDEHLKKIGAAGFIYVNTVGMHRDVEDAFRRFRADIEHDPALFKRAAKRLEWKEENLVDHLDIAATPPPPVGFIWAK
jgi:hypothetical protein